MSYRFVVNYPEHSIGNGARLDQMQRDILRRFPECKVIENFVPHNGEDYHTTIYETDNPQAIARVATALKNADSRLFVGVIDRAGTDIYYHPVELSGLNSAQKSFYKYNLAHLPHMERVIHDYLTNLYHQVPTKGPHVL